MNLRGALAGARDAGIIKMAPKREGTYDYIANSKVEDLKDEYTIFYAAFRSDKYHAVLVEDLGLIAFIGIPVKPMTLGASTTMIVNKPNDGVQRRLSPLHCWRIEPHGENMQNTIAKFEPINTGPQKKRKRSREMAEAALVLCNLHPKK